MASSFDESIDTLVKGDGNYSKRHRFLLHASQICKKIREILMKRDKIFEVILEHLEKTASFSSKNFFSMESCEPYLLMANPLEFVARLHPSNKSNELTIYLETSQTTSYSFIQFGFVNSHLFDDYVASNLMEALNGKSVYEDISKNYRLQYERKTRRIHRITAEALDNSQSINFEFQVAFMFHIEEQWPLPVHDARPVTNPFFWLALPRCNQPTSYYIYIPNTQFMSVRKYGTIVSLLCYMRRFFRGDDWALRFLLTLTYPEASAEYMEQPLSHIFLSLLEKQLMLVEESILKRPELSAKEKKDWSYFAVRLHVFISRLIAYRDGKYACRNYALLDIMESF